MNKNLFAPLTLSVVAAIAMAGCSNPGSGQAGANDPVADSSTASTATSESAPAFTSTVQIPPSQQLAFNVDDNYDPCNNFAEFVNANWNKANPIPSDQSRWGAFGILHKKTQLQQKSILEKAAWDAKHGQADTLEQKLGDLYAAGMDTDAINKLGYAPIKPQLQKIAGLQNTDDVVQFINASANDGDSYVFFFYVNADFEDATQQIGYAHQAGLGLPTRGYYLKDNHKKQRQDYLTYMANLLELVGTPADQAKSQAQSVLDFETKLAKASLSPTELRDLDNQYNFVSVAEADKVSPHFAWQDYFNALGVDVGDGFSLSQPKFFAEFDKLLANAPTSTWQAYLKVHLLDNAAPYLTEDFQKASFAFHGKAMNGQPEMKTRWKRVIGAVNQAMGMGLGKLYVQEYFPPETKARAEKLVTNVRDALKQHIKDLDWMSDATKQKALKKWSLFLPKIGYPDDEHWRDWSGLDVQAGKWYANLEAAGKYNYHYNLAKLGTKTDRQDWFMTPQTVNAYYSPNTNTINFPAAILQPPFFYPEGDDAVNYGGIGFVIGHEASHGFDDQGSQFDGHGNRSNWWTKEDKKAFDSLTGALADQYDQYTPIEGKPDLHVNGKLTLGEDIGDLGGLNVAYTALQMALQNKPELADKKIGGWTQNQRFFMSSARVWEGSVRPEHEEKLLNVDPHAPAAIRAFATASNMPQFSKAFQCKAGDKMKRANPVEIW